jgi:hypothetical protein
MLGSKLKSSTQVVGNVIAESVCILLQTLANYLVPNGPMVFLIIKDLY